MSATRRPPWCLGIVLALSVWVGPAHADPAGDAEAQKAFEEGRKLWEAKDCPRALPLFQRAVDHTGSPNARLYLARCLRDTGKIVASYDEMARTVRDARERAQTDPRYVATRDAAAGEIALLEAKVGKVVISLDSTLAGATVTLDGAPIDPASLSKPMTVEPGTRKIAAKPGDGAEVELSVEVAAGATQAVTLARRVADAPPPKVEAPTAPPPEDDGGGFGVVRALGIGVCAVAVGGFVTFAVGTVQAESELSTLEAECGPGPCPDDSHADVIESGKTAEVVAFVGLGIGVAAAIAGVTMIVLGGPSEPASTAWQPTGDGVRLRF